MTRYGIYVIPGIDAAATPSAVALKSTADAWFARADMHDVTVDARRYGFHATLKAPFRPAPDISEQTIVDTVDELASNLHPVTLPVLRIAVIQRFRALVPTGPTDHVDRLAATVVRELDTLRAPLTSQDVARRQPDRLSRRQRELLCKWGYPYVLDEFRVHLTLTDGLADDRAITVDDMLRNHFASVSGLDLTVTALTVVVESVPGQHFQILSTHPLCTNDTPAYLRERP